jgi:hypothetical protein
VPYSISPLNLTSGQTISADYSVEVAFTNPDAPNDVLLVLTCMNTSGHGPHALSDQENGPSGSIPFDLDHSDITEDLTGITIRGTICTMDPITQQAAFEVTNITVQAP